MAEIVGNNVLKDFVTIEPNPVEYTGEVSGLITLTVDGVAALLFQ